MSSGALGTRFGIQTVAVEGCKGPTPPPNWASQQPRLMLRRASWTAWLCRRFHHWPIPSPSQVPYPPERHCRPACQSTLPLAFSSAPLPTLHQKQGSLLWEQSSPKSLFIFLGVNLRLRKSSGMTAQGTKAHLETRIMWNLSLRGSPTRPITISSFPRISANFFMGSPESYILSANCRDLYRG